MLGSKFHKRKIVLNNYSVGLGQASDFIQNKHLTRTILIISLLWQHMILVPKYGSCIV